MTTTPKVETTMTVVVEPTDPAITLVISNEGSVIRGVLRQDGKPQELKVIYEGSPGAVVRSAVTHLEVMGLQRQAAAIKQHFEAMAWGLP